MTATPVAVIPARLRRRRRLSLVVVSGMIAAMVPFGFGIDAAVAAPSDTISGTVFEDTAGDLLDDGAIGSADNPGIAGVSVSLFNDEAVAQAADTPGEVGQYASIAIGSDGNPVVSYGDSTNGDLKVLHCDDPSCSSFTTTTVESAGSVGQHTSLAIGADGFPVISHYDWGNLDLRVYKCSNVACTAGSGTAVDTAGSQGTGSSIAIGTDGLPIISYFDGTNYDLKVAHCNDAACTTSTRTAIDTSSTTGVASSLTIGSDGLAVISYRYVPGADLKVAHCDNVACTSGTSTTVDTTGDLAGSSSITQGSDGYPVVAYFDLTNRNLKVAHCTNLTCTARNIAVADSVGDVGYNPSVAVGLGGNPIIAHWDFSNTALKLTYCDDLDCSSVTHTSPDTAGNVGSDPSMVLDAGGNPVVAYQAQGTYDLKILTMGNGVADAGDTFVSTTTTDVNGGYSFSGLPAGAYLVAVESQAVAAAAGYDGAQTDSWAEQTYGPAGSLCADGSGATITRGSPGACYGGQDAGTSDSFDSGSPDATAAEHITSISTGTGPVDFGFSFNTVTNTLAGDNRDDAAGNRTVQGSLRQFIQNANAITGTNTMRFVPTGPTNDGTWWEIAVSSALPAITGAATTIDGSAYEYSDGVTARNTNTGFLGTNAAGGVTVGVDDVALPQVDAPELEIDSAGVTGNGIEVRADDATVRNLAIYGFGSTGVALTDGDIAVPSGLSVGGLTVEQNVIGTSAGSFTDPGAATRSDGSGVALQDVTGAQTTIQNNLFGYLDELAVSVLSSDNIVVSGNESRDVTQGSNIYIDAMSAEDGSSNVEFSGNLIDGAQGNGISMWQASGAHLVRNNTIANVGTGGAQTAAVAVFGTGSTVDLNVITGNSGPGVAVVGENPSGGYSWPAAADNRISRNTFGGNAGLAIDLTESSDNDADHEQGDGVTLTAGTNATTGNNGLDAPVITAATFSSVSGASCASCEIEVYRAVGGTGDNSGGTDYGEGVEYLGTVTADSGGDWSLTGITALSPGDEVSAIAVDGSNNTSEFSANFATPCVDSDSDGLCDLEEDANTDADDDPSTNPGPDTDGDLTPNYLDDDDDDDLIPTASENADPNGDGDPRDAVDGDWDGEPDYLDDPTSFSLGSVAREQKISSGTGGLAASLSDNDRFGRAVTSIGDIDGDGVTDVAVGAFLDDDGGPDRGAVYVLFLNADGTVKAQQKISDLAGSLNANLDDSDYFGLAVAGIGDINGDGTGDLAVGAYRDDDGGANKGAVYILFLDEAGTVTAEQKISDSDGGLATSLAVDDWFGVSVAGIGDLDGDGINDIAVGSYLDDGGTDRGAVFVLFLNADGTVKDEQKISDTAGGFTSPLDDSDLFGEAVAAVGDLDGDGVTDIVVGANGDDDGGTDRGAVFILFLDTDGTVKSDRKISDTSGGLSAVLDDGDRFGSAAAGVGDVDADGVRDIAVAAHLDDDGDTNRGAVHILFLNADGTVKNEQKISDTAGGFTSPLDDSDLFGHGVAGIGDLDGDGPIDLAVGAHLDDDGGSARGAVYILKLCADSDADGLCDNQEDANTDADSDPSTNPGPNTDGDANPNYLDDDDDGDLTPTASENADPNGDGDPRDALDSDRDAQPDYLDPPTTAADGTVAHEQVISETLGDLTTTLGVSDHFGRAIAPIGDLDGDGVNDLAVGAPNDDDGNSDRGAVYVLFMNANGTVKGEQKISDTLGGFTAVLDNADEFGISVTGLGDLDGDGINDIAVGAHQDDDGLNGNGGAVYVLFMNTDGTVRSYQKISETDGGLGVLFDANDRFGGSVADIGDLDGDGLNDIVVGAKDDDDGFANAGAVYVLFLNADGTVKGKQKISQTTGGVTGSPLGGSDGFGIGVAGLGDVDGDGNGDIAVGSYWDDDGGTNHGAAYVLFLDTDGTVLGQQKISDTAGGFTGTLESNDEFGTAVGAAGDIDADGVPDLLVGTPKDDDGNSLSGAAYVLFLNANGTVKAHQKISNLEGGLGVTINTSDQFGFAVAGIGDLDGDGTIGIAVGTFGDDDGFVDSGSVYILDLGDRTIVVNSTDDDGDSNLSDGICDTGQLNSASATECTLRAAIEQANVASSSVTIEFDMPAGETGHSAGVWTISPGAVFDQIIQTVVIDGRTQTGWTSTPVVEINGAGAGASGDGFRIAADDVEIRGLAINRFLADGIELASGAADAVIAQNHIGLDASGLIDRGNAGRGIDLGAGSGPTAVGGPEPTDRNVISGNGGDGIIIWNSNANTVLNNFIGTDVTGNSSAAGIGNGADGIALGGTSANNVIGQVGDTNVISGNANDGVENDATGANNVVYYNVIGLGIDVTSTVPNGRYGVVLYDGANNTFVYQNLIAGNTDSGIIIDGNGNAATTANQIIGNWIGLNLASQPRPNGGRGVHIFDGATLNVVGGAPASYRNIISGNTDSGVLISGSATSGNRVENNYIGTNIAGDAGVANNLHGIRIDQAPSTEVLDNLISGNNIHGVYVYGGSSTGTQILRNTIGTNATATAPIPNLYDGVRLEGGSTATTIGTQGNGNVISGNTQRGIDINDTGGNTVQANWIGTNTGGDDLGNGMSGVYTDVFNASDNLIGGAGAGEGNTIAFNAEGITFDSGTDNSVLRNSIYSNDSLGIDVDDDGVSPNGAGDPLDYPVITSATASGGTITVDFDLDVPAGDYRIEFFDNTAADVPSGYGEGETWVDSYDVLTHPGGPASYSTTIPGSPNDIITATTTEAVAAPFGSTSEFSAAATATVADPVVNSGGNGSDVSPGDGSCDTGGTNSEGDPECTLDAAIQEANALGGSVTITFAIPDSDPLYRNLGPGLSYWRIQPATNLDPVTAADVSIDATTQTTHAVGQGYAVNDLGPEVEINGSVVGAGNGLEIQAGGAEIRGLVINRFTTGIAVLGGDGTVIAGNYLGPDPSGAIGLVGNDSEGVLVYGATNTVIGGTTVADRNVISGNLWRGVTVDDWSDGAPFVSDGTRIIGNYIGTNATGTASLPYDNIPRHQQIGIYFLETRDGVVGTVAAGNVISGNHWHGIYLWAPSGSNHTIQNNLVGLDAAGSGAVPNGWESPTRAAVYLSNAPGNLVGGDDPAEANTIAHNASNGLVIFGAAAVDNAVIGNKIYDNGGLGLDLGLDGVTPNDSPDDDPGPNHLLNYPVISSATGLGGSVTIDFDLDVPAGDYRIEFFDNAAQDTSGHGEGETWIDSYDVVAHPGGLASYSTTIPGSAGDVIAATTTVDLGLGTYGSTSEFSAVVIVVPESTPILDSSVRRSDLATAGGFATVVGGVVGDALDLDGVDDHLAGPGLDITDAELSLGGWVRLDTATAQHTLISKRDSAGNVLYELAIDGVAGEATATVRLSGVPVTVQGGVVTTAAWHQLTAVWDGADLILYVDGNEVDRGGAVGTLATDPATEVTIGARDDGTQRLDGRVDHVSVAHDVATAAGVAAHHTNVDAPGAFVTLGAEQTGVPGAWTTSTAQSRSGSYSLEAPETTGPGSAAWAVATGIDEPGLVFESWWWMTTATGIEISSGTRAGSTPTDQHSGTAVDSPFEWELRRRIGSTDSVDATVAGTATTGAWVEVEMWTDQLGDTRLIVDGTEVIGWTSQGNGLVSGSAGLLVDRLPNGEHWYVDDPRARKLVTPEPVTSLGPLDRP